MMLYDISKLHLPLSLPGNILKSEFDPDKISYGHSKTQPSEILDNSLIELLYNNGILVPNVQLFRFPPSLITTVPHIDDDGIDDQVNLNYVVNSGSSTIIWYKLKEHHTGYIASGLTGATPRRYHPRDVTQIYTTTSVGACLFQSGVPHAVLNTENDRKCISIKLRDFNKNPIRWEDAIIIFKEWISCTSV